MHTRSIPIREPAGKSDFGDSSAPCGAAFLRMVARHRPSAPGTLREVDTRSHER